MEVSSFFLCLKGRLDVEADQRHMFFGILVLWPMVIIVAAS